MRENAVVVAAQQAIETKCSSLIEFGVSDEDVITHRAGGGQIQILIEPSTCDHGHWVSQAFDRIRNENNRRSSGFSTLAVKVLTLLRTKRWLTARDSDYGAETGFNQSGEVFSKHSSAQKVIIIGGSYKALVESLDSLDFETIIVDPRTVWANPDAFNTKIVSAWPDALTEIGIDKDTAIVALTHDPKFDDKAISMGLKSSAFARGALGEPSASCRRAMVNTAK